jgi:hypothetical protein
MLTENFSPNSSKKVGHYYYYDAGLLGYTEQHISVVKRDELYPIEGKHIKIRLYIAGH